MSLRKTRIAAVELAGPVAEGDPSGHAAPLAQRRLSPKQDKLSDDEQVVLAKMCQANREIEQEHSLARSCWTLVSSITKSA